MRVDQIEKPQSMGPEYLWLICFLAIAPALFLLPINHDAIWQIWIGRKLLHGATLYTDIIEVNPPLWFWMAVPLAGVGEMFAIEARLIVIGFFIAAIGLSLFLTPARYRLLLFGVLVLMPLRDFGQREHFTLIATAPYVFTIAARKEGVEVGHPLLIGLFAAFGFALKPYFAIAPLALELLIWSEASCLTRNLGPGALGYRIFGCRLDLRAGLYHRHRTDGAQGLRLFPGQLDTHVAGHDVWHCCRWRDPGHAEGLQCYPSASRDRTRLPFRRFNPKQGLGVSQHPGERLPAPRHSD